jgi:hypothetical protein
MLVTQKSLQNKSFQLCIQQYKVLMNLSRTSRNHLQLMWKNNVQHGR